MFDTKKLFKFAYPFYSIRNIVSCSEENEDTIELHVKLNLISIVLAKVYLKTGYGNIHAT